MVSTMFTWRADRVIMSQLCPSCECGRNKCGGGDVKYATNFCRKEHALVLGSKKLKTKLLDHCEV